MSKIRHNSTCNALRTAADGHFALTRAFSIDVCVRSYLGVLVDSSVEEMRSVLQMLDGLELAYCLIVSKRDNRTPADVEQLRAQTTRVCKRGEQQPMLSVSAHQPDEYDGRRLMYDLMQATAVL